MRNNQRKQPNAYKHGVFSRPAIVPGEDGKEFDTLYSDLVEEWKPSGATEEEAVFSIAKAMWRKRRAQNFIEIQLVRNSNDPSHASYDENLGLTAFSAFLRVKPEVAFKDYAARCLRADKIDYLKRKFPRSNFNSTQEWVKALTDEIELMVPSETDDADHSMGKIGALFLSAATFTDEFFENELRLDERLDIMIDRAVKRLVQTKAMKQMLGQTDAERAKDRVRNFGAKKAANW